ncbi:MAG: DUF1501 domain-containing protein [Pirellulaceae bacterium]|jgi:uncharacterized protein (DUF1501 family)|nr:DUF1501 domain-containing protein [Pirellulaceae bacterium]
MSKPQISTRRGFIAQGLGVVGVGAALPNFLIQTALAGPKAESDLPILVVVQLSGGNDGLASIIPYGDDAYAQNRPTLRAPVENLLKIDDYSAFCPALGPFKKMYDEDQLAVIQAVGYPNPNKSHFTSMDIWHVANNSFRRVPGQEAYGWIGRYTDTAFKDVIDSKLSMAVNMGKSPMAMRGRFHAGLALKDPRSFQYMAANNDKMKKELYRELNDSDSKPSKGSSPLDFISKTSSSANRASDEILKLINATKSESYPESRLAQSLQMVSAMIKGNLSTRVFYVSQGGFDTHAGQATRHAKLMTDFSEAIAAFQADLTGQGNADRVLTVAFSEFGRVVKENGSQGTDHGKAAPMFLFGPNVKSGLYGESPNLTDLDGGDLKFKIDFRSVYATVLDQWMKAPSQKILGAKFEHLGFMA